MSSYARQSEGRPVQADSLLLDQTTVLVRAIMVVRLATLVLTLPWITRSNLPSFAIAGVLLGAAVASYIPLRYWPQLHQQVAQKRVLLSLDLSFGFCIMVVVGPDTPFWSFTLSTAALGGLVYGSPGAILACVILFFGYLAGLVRNVPIETIGWQELVTMPSLYFMAATAGWSVRSVFQRQVEHQQRLQHALHARAVAEERARLAREMHDSLAKTLAGLSMSAAAFEDAMDEDPEQARPFAKMLSRSINTARAEARDLLTDLRFDDAGTLAEAVERQLRRWSQDTQVEVDAKLDDVDLRSPGARYETGCVLKEALANVSAHSGAQRVRVVLERRGDEVVLCVEDDGCGFEWAGDFSDMADRGSFGLLGMAERARRAGGRLEIRSAHGKGTSLVLRLPEVGQRRDGMEVAV